jgi:hypothetical protein
MKDKHRPALTGLLIGVILLLPLLGSIAEKPATIASTDGIYGGSIEAAGSSSIFYTANNTVSGGITIGCNNTYVDRLDRDVKFTVNATKMVQAGGWNPAWGTDVARCYLNITRPDSTTTPYAATEIGGTQVFSFTLHINITMITGIYKIRASIENASKPYNGGFNFQPVTNMTVYNILPVGSVATNTTTVYRNGTLAFFISIFDPETPFPALAWNVSVYRNDTAPVKLKTWFKNDTLNQTYTFKGNNIIGNYAFFIEIRDGSGGSFGESVSWFKVLNNPPVIHSASYNYTANLKRQVEKMRFEVNVTDPDNVKNFTSVKVIFEHAPDDYFPEKINFTSAPLTYKPATGNFTGNVTVPSGFPSGNATIIIEARDNDPKPAVSRFYPANHKTTIVTNNPPVVHDVFINGKSPAGGLRFSLYNNLDFTVNVTDIEDKIDFLQVTLIGPGGKVVYFILGPPPYTVRIPASALTPGSWGVFIKVSDTEGGENAVGYDDGENMGVIEVDPDLRDMTAYIIGGVLLVIAGFVIGGMVIWRYANARISAIRRDMIIKAKSKDVQEAKKAKPGEKGAPSRYIEPTAKAEPEAKPEPKQPAKAAEKPAASRPFVGTQSPPVKGKLPAPEKKQDGSKPKPK